MRTRGTSGNGFACAYASFTLRAWNRAATAARSGAATFGYSWASCASNGMPVVAR
ncbi:MAG TPA: hypothetical protein VMH78_02070 [Thermoplasmata archaeon]|nr:hypothetical protein [Thermoplasmata archaeon]